MAQSSRIVVAVALSALCAAPSMADIGFGDAAAIARAAYPTASLFGIRARVQNGVPFFATKNINAFNTLFFGLKIQMSDGAIVGDGLEEILPPNDLETAAVLERLPEAVLDFTDALAISNASTNRSDAEVSRVTLASELFMLLFNVRYSDGVDVLVDAITGQVVDHGDVATPKNSVLPATLADTIDAACDAAGANWFVFSSSLLAHPDGMATAVLLLDPLNGRVKDVSLLNETVEVVQFIPVGHLAEVVEEVRSAVPSVVVTHRAFLEHVAATFPDCVCTGAGVQSRLRNGVVRTRWTIAVLTAQGQQLEYSVDATLPLGIGLALAQFPTPPIVGDLDGDGHVLANDLVELLSTYRMNYPPHDLDRDGTVSGGDLAILLGNWG